ncbi:3'(2'),5'-bisphosphate nucleotidase CysQ [Candidatus Woesearchaeota archaeon]|nr:3'(2'),5'-bisphosphate nucleotidase CysQ [Candidatus Woesearchaeota archaeon]
MYEKELSVVEKVMREAEGLLRKHYDCVVDVQRKKDESPVTAADKELDAHIRKRLFESFPGDAVNSEESPWNTSRGRRMWLVDPIDGTDNFIEKNDEFSVCVALVADGQPVLGVVYAPLLGKRYVALAGQGAFLNGKKITVDASRDFSEAIQVVSRHLGGDAGKSEFPKNFRLGSSALRMCAVAEGLADVFFYRKTGDDSRLHTWDLAASAIILREAGGAVVDLEKQELLFGGEPSLRRGVIASRKDFIEQL